MPDETLPTPLHATEWTFLSNRSVCSGGGILTSSLNPVNPSITVHLVPSVKYLNASAKDLELNDLDIEDILQLLLSPPYTTSLLAVSGISLGNMLLPFSSSS